MWGAGSEAYSDLACLSSWVYLLTAGKYGKPGLRRYVNGVGHLGCDVWTGIGEVVKEVAEGSRVRPLS